MADIFQTTFWNAFYHDIKNGTAMTTAEHESNLKNTTGTPYPTLTGELQGVCCEYIEKMDFVIIAPQCMYVSSVVGARIRFLYVSE